MLILQPPTLLGSRALIPLIAACSLVLVACNTGDSDTGSDTTNGADTSNDSDAGSGSGNGSGDDTTPTDPLVATLDSIQEHIFTPICTQCHRGGNAPEGLLLEEGQAHGHLVGVDSVQKPGLERVEAGNPDDSYLIHKLEGGPDIVNDRMPRNGPPYLDQSEIDVIRQWIADGALAPASNSATSRSVPAAVTGTWPVEGSQLDDAPANIRLVFNRELDTTRLHWRSVTLQRETDGQWQPMETVSIEVTWLDPTTIQLAMPDMDWQSGRYRVRVAGSGPTPVTTRGGEVIDGDADGRPGGDFVLNFAVGARR